ncbi:MAG: hypothetical protein SGPRY_006235 [Prymnesium sp.]
MKKTRQTASEVVSVSSYWPSGWQWHPFQALGEQDVFAYGDSRLAWAPRLRTGDSQGKFVSASDSADVTAHNVTGRLSFYHNPSETFERYGYTEHIELKFRQAVYPAALDIGENRGMCAITRIMGRNSATGSGWYDLWRATHSPTFDGVLASGAKRAECEQAYKDAKRYRLFHATICQQPLPMDEIRLELDTRSVDDWNEIDFVTLIGRERLPPGVLPANTTGVYYTPNPGFMGSDSAGFVAYDCPFDFNRRSELQVVPVEVDGFFPPPSPPPDVLVANVNLGMLLPMFATEKESYVRLSFSPMLGVYQALAEINNKNDSVATRTLAVADDLLPHTHISMSYYDSKCDDTKGLTGALYLTRDAFGGQGVSAIVGAGCSGASVSAAKVTDFSRVPIISPSSTSPVLSNGKAYPYFLRTVPSDDYVAVVLVDVLTQLWGYTTAALAHSTDTYGASGAQASRPPLPRAKRCVTSAAVVLLWWNCGGSFVKGATDLSAVQTALLRYPSRIVVLFCQVRGDMGGGRGEQEKKEQDKAEIQGGGGRRGEVVEQ